MASTETRPSAAENTTAVGATADPGPLGLAGFAATTMVLSFVNAGIIDGSAVNAVLALALFYGGLGQIIAGLLEYRRGNTFGVTAFCTYGGFWLAFAFYVWFFKGLNNAGSATGMFLLMFGIVTAFLTLSTLRINGALLVVFVLLTLTYVVLAIGAFAGSQGLNKVGGVIGIITAIAAFYTSAAVVTNATWKRQVLPIFPF
ncbi:MAG TPA: acetate uptake transporter [Pseudonocardiaceae bacterium]|nr:acetate uptake transporter [Pseudonocardiaceae bacterium]